MNNDRNYVWVILVENWSSCSGTDFGCSVFADYNSAVKQVTKSIEQYKQECLADGFDEEDFVFEKEGNMRSFSPDDWEKNGVIFNIVKQSIN